MDQIRGSKAWEAFNALISLMHCVKKRNEAGLAFNDQQRL